MMKDVEHSRQRLWIRVFLLAVFLTPVLSLLCFAALRLLGYELRP